MYIVSLKKIGVILCTVHVCTFKDNGDNVQKAGVLNKKFGKVYTMTVKTLITNQHTRYRE